MKPLLARLARLWSDEQRLAFYEWDFGVQTSGARDEAVVEIEADTPLSAAARLRVFPTTNPVSRWLMRQRWRRRRIRLFALMVDRQLVAYAGIRAWSLERRQSAWLGRPGPILGPAWTDPAHRGKGLHRRLLFHRLDLCRRGGADVAYTSAHVYNTVSRRNIEHAGFRPRGCVVVRRLCFRLYVSVRPLPNEPAAVLGDAGS